mmetsp:Transcript_32494/g.44546  ORF Transcript_32494/g.44546 Transcript_32494/m.44546 type:complete len:97 (+) Transcript_32494:154-444(+)
MILKNDQIRISAVVVAFRALGWGTALCGGTACGLAAVFVGTTNVTSWAELRRFIIDTKKHFRLPDKKPSPETPESEAFIKTVEDFFNSKPNIEPKK